MRKPNKIKMTGVNSRFAGVSESIFNGFLLKMLLRSLPVYILKQLFFSISVNSGRILTSPLRGSVNILPLFTSISKNNCSLSGGDCPFRDYLLAHLPCFEGQHFLYAPPPPNSKSISMLHKKLDSVLGLERWGGPLCGYFSIAILTLTRS